jgi:enoyl-CoA hydratase/carnithine racemase
VERVAELASYAERYSCARLRREDGILEVRLHRDGGPLVWSEASHRELPDLFADIAADTDNRVVILTGTGDSFCANIEFTRSAAPTSAQWDKTYREGRRLLQNLLEIEVPTIAAVNGDARIHAELALLCDVVLAADTTIFQDAPHFPNGVVPGDGVHIVWPLLLGPNRGRYFLLTGQELTAADALALGVVGEVLPLEQLHSRAWELARNMAAKPALTLRYTRIALTQDLRKRLLTELGHGLLLEGAALAAAYPETSEP